MDENSSFLLNVQLPGTPSAQKVARKVRCSEGTPPCSNVKSPRIRVRTSEQRERKRLNDSFFDEKSIAEADVSAVVTPSADTRLAKCDAVIAAQQSELERLYFENLQQLGSLPLSCVNLYDKDTEAFVVTPHALIVRASEVREDQGRFTEEWNGSVVEGMTSMLKLRSLSTKNPVDLIVQGQFGRRMLLTRVVEALLQGYHSLQELYAQAAVVFSAMGSSSLYEIEAELSHGWTEIVFDAEKKAPVAVEIHPASIGHALVRPNQARLYNVFHQILAAKPNAEELALNVDEDVIGIRFALIAILGQDSTESLQRDVRSDYYAFTDLCAALTALGFSKEEQKIVFATCAGLLHWSSVDKDETHVAAAERLLGISRSDLAALNDATNLAAVYEDLFSWVAHKVNMRFESELNIDTEVSSPVALRVFELSSADDSVTCRTGRTAGAEFSALRSLQAAVSRRFDSISPLEGRLAGALLGSRNEQFVFHSVAKPIIANVQPGETLLEYDSGLVTQLFPAAATMFDQGKTRVRVAERDWAVLTCESLVSAAEARVTPASLLLPQAIHAAEVIRALGLDSASVTALVQDLQCNVALEALEQNVLPALRIWLKSIMEKWVSSGTELIQQRLAQRIECAAQRVESGVFKQVEGFCDAHAAFLKGRSDGLSEQLRLLAAVARRGEQGLEEASIRAKIRSDDAMTKRAALASAVRLYPLPTIVMTSSEKPREAARSSLMARLTRTPVKRVQSVFRREGEAAVADTELEGLVAMMLHNTSTHANVLWFKRGLAALIKRWTAEAKLRDEGTRARAIQAAMDAIQAAPLLDDLNMEVMNATLRVSLLACFLLAFDLCDPASKDSAGFQFAHRARAWVLQVAALKPHATVRDRLEKLATGDDELYARVGEAWEARVDLVIDTFGKLLGAMRSRVLEVRMVKNAEAAMVEATGSSLFSNSASLASEGGRRSRSEATEESSILPEVAESLPEPPKYMTEAEKARAHRREEWKAQHVNCTALYDYADPDGDELYLSVTKGEILWIPTQNQAGTALSKGKDWVMVERYTDDPANPPKDEDGKPIRPRGYVPFTYVGFPGYQ